LLTSQMPAKQSSRWQAVSEFMTITHHQINRSAGQHLRAMRKAWRPA